MRLIIQRKEVFLGNGTSFDHRESLQLCLELIHWMLFEAKGFSIQGIYPETTSTYLKINVQKRGWNFMLFPLSSSKNNISLQCPNSHSIRIRVYNDLKKPCQGCIDSNSRYNSPMLQQYLIDTDFIRNPPE